MKHFLMCLLYIAALGVLSFVVGRLIPKHWFHADRFPWVCHPAEQKLWKRLHVRKWQAKIPDMSRIFVKIMPEKKLTKENYENLPRMIEETCVAEWTHILLSIAGLGLLKIWSGVGGVCITIIYIVLGNLPFIVVQRYNRPRLQKLFGLWDSFSVAGIPYAGLTAVLTAAFAFVPYIGGFLSCAFGILFTLLAAPNKALLCLIVYQATQFVENQFIYPHVVGNSVGLSPFWTLLAVLLGGKLFGVLGMIFFIPLMALVSQLLHESIERRLHTRKPELSNVQSNSDENTDISQ